MNDALNHFRQQAASRAETLAAPDRLNEDWRYGRPAAYAAAVLDRLQTPPPVADDAVTATLAGPVLPGVSIQPLGKPEELEHLASVHSIGSGRILAMQQSLPVCGLCISIAPGCIVEHPIEITCTVRGEMGLLSPSILILMGEGSKATIREIHRGDGGNSQMIVGVQKAVLAPHASLSYELVQELGSTGRAMEIAEYRLAEGATLNQLTRHLHTEWARQETTCVLAGREARAELFSANAVDGSRVLDQRTRQIHSSPGAYSNLLYKNVVGGTATATFAGMILVEPGAHETDAYQANRNMMRSEQASINSLPGLEILADGVKCSHGSATSPMDEEQLFYLQSRGIPEEQAQRLVAEGFLHDAVVRFRGETGE